MSQRAVCSAGGPETNGTAVLTIEKTTSHDRLRLVVHLGLIDDLQRWEHLAAG
jgi:hypothetical protein